MPEANETKKYRKLPGRSAGVVGIASLWLGDDHLLAVTTTFGIERYRRYYYRNIEALLFRRTPAGLAWNIGFAFITGVFALIALVVWFGGRNNGSSDSDSVAAVVILGGIGFLFLIFLIINTLRGPTCAAFVQTAAGLQRLDTPVRLRIARRILQRIETEIQSTQTSVPVETAAAALLPAETGGIASENS